MSSNSLLPQFSCLGLPVFPEQRWLGLQAGRAGGDAAGSAEEGGPGCHAPPPTAARVQRGEVTSKSFSFFNQDDLIRTELTSG